MATCVQSIAEAAATGFSDVPEIVSMTQMPIEFDSNKNQLLRLSSAAVQSITFNISLTQDPTGTMAVTVTIYRMTGSTPTSTGSVNITSLNSSFSRDFLPGDYILCIRTANLISYTGTLMGSFVGFPPSARFAPIFSVGEHARAEMPATPIIRECNEALRYEILEGELPPGIRMNEIGIIEGVLPNLDCVPDTDNEYSPAQNWYMTDSDSISKPIGRQWRFRVKVSIAGIEDASAESWFCIRIHNNWDFDRDNFLSQMPFTTSRVLRDPEPATKLPDSLCPPTEVETPRFRPKPLPSMVCEPCDSGPATVSRPTVLIPIPEPMRAVPPAMIAMWYAANKDRPDRECCEVTQFLADLEASPMFQRLLIQNGLIPGETGPSARELIVAAQFGEFLQLSTVERSGPRDIDTLMKEWKDKENSRLPIYLEPETGELMLVVLS